MKKLIQVVVVLVVAVVMSGCVSNYHYENSGETTETVRKLPDGGYEKTTTYKNQGTVPVIRSYPGYGYGHVSWSWNHGGSYNNGSPVYVVPAPPALALEGLLPTAR